MKFLVFSIIFSFTIINMLIEAQYWCKNINFNNMIDFEHLRKKFSNNKDQKINQPTYCLIYATDIKAMLDMEF